MIFIDADAFIASSVPTDSNHQKARKLFGKLKDTGEELVTSWDTIDEVATKLSYTTTHKVSLKFLDYIKSSSIKMVYVDENLSKKILRLFKKQTSKRVSLTDCTNMIIMRELGIKTIFSFDKHYTKNGFHLLR